MDTEIRVSTESWPWRRKFACCSARIQTHDLSITSLVLNHWAIPAPQVLCEKTVHCVIKRKEERLFKKKFKGTGVGKLDYVLWKIWIKKLSFFLGYPKVSCVPCNGLSLARLKGGGVGKLDYVLWKIWIKKLSFFKDIPKWVVSHVTGSL